VESHCNLVQFEDKLVQDVNESCGIGDGSYTGMDENLESEPFLLEDRERDVKTADPSVEILPDIRLPPRGRILEITRWKVFGVYRRIFLAVVLLNIWHGHKIITIKRRSKYSPLLVNISTAAAANMLVAVLIRQDYIINTLFRFCWFVPF
jgi:hypothetical protein